MYSVQRFGEMAADRLRMDAYEQALTRAITPDSVVLDIGAGTGYLSLFAAARGARRVHACDPNSSIWLLEELARENGLADRIVVHHKTSTELVLDEPVDIVVADLRGTMPMLEPNFASLRDAKARLLAPGGTLIPRRDTFHVGAFEEDRLVAMLRYATSAFVAAGFRATAIERSLANTPMRDPFPLKAEAMLTTSAEWGHAVYGEARASFAGETQLEVLRPGTCHGLALWFEADLGAGIGFSTAPGTQSVYARMLLPLGEPIAVKTGERLDVRIQAEEHGERYAWDVACVGSDGQRKRELRQTTFFGVPTSLAEITRQLPEHVPELSAAGERARALLDAVDGKKTTRALLQDKGPHECELRALLSRLSR